MLPLLLQVVESIMIVLSRTMLIGLLIFIVIPINIIVSIISLFLKEK